jgi:hypothetical protein
MDPRRGRGARHRAAGGVPGGPVQAVLRSACHLADGRGGAERTHARFGSGRGAFAKSATEPG